MRIKNLNQHCGECLLTAYCGNPFDYCLCTDGRFSNMSESEYQGIAMTATGIKKLDACHECNRSECGLYRYSDDDFANEACEHADEAQDYYCEQIADYVNDYVKMKPILFNTEMVRAILDGRKTVTRRIVDPKYIQSETAPIKTADGIFHFWCYGEVKSPYKVGDILYVRETWSTQYDGINDDNGYGQYVYKADGTKLDNSRGSASRWYPSIHMPKSAARIFLKVTDVRVERLQDITEEQAKAEGVSGLCYDVETGEERYDMTFFKILWDSTIKKQDIDLYGWDANPFVWVIEFERVEPND